MVSNMKEEFTVVRVEAGPGTGDRVYVVERNGRYLHIEEPLNTARVEVVEGDMKFGPRKIRMRW